MKHFRKSYDGEYRYFLKVPLSIGYIKALLKALSMRYTLGSMMVTRGFVDICHKDCLAVSGKRRIK